jgi:hypothetical protein
MEYVGWRDVKSAMRYIDAADPFAGMGTMALVAENMQPCIRDQRPHASSGAVTIEGD